MTTIDFGPDRIKVAPPAVEAFEALAAVLRAHDYDIRPADTDSYNCRAIKGGTGRSLHSYGIAVDVNWQTNPYKETPTRPAVKFSNKSTQAERGEEVRRGLADTDMTPEMIRDVANIRTQNGKQVFTWGGSWNKIKDSMHFELRCSPDDLRSGIDWNSVRGGRDQVAKQQPESFDLRRPESLDLRRLEAFFRRPDDTGGGVMDTDRPSRFTETPTEVSQAGVEFIRQAEGERLTAYDDGTGVWTIGVGHTTAAGPPRVSPGMRISREESGDILRQDLKKFAGYVNDAVRVPVRQNEFDALVSLCFNVGPGAFGKSTVVRELNSGDRQAAADGFLLFNKAGGRVLEGLVKRRQGERQLFLRGGPDLQDWTMRRESAPLLTSGDRNNQVIALQKMLASHNYHVGEIDGIFGPLTKQAILAFQSDAGLPTTGTVDMETWNRLGDAFTRPLSDKRVGADAQTLRELGSQTVKSADRTGLLGIIASVLGGLGITNSALLGVSGAGSGAPAAAAKTGAAQVSPDLVQAINILKQIIPPDQLASQLGNNPVLGNLLKQADTVGTAVTAVRPQVQTIFDVFANQLQGDSLAPIMNGVAALAGTLIPGFGGSLVTLGIGLATTLLSRQITNRRVQDHRDGANIDSKERR